MGYRGFAVVLAAFFGFALVAEARQHYPARGHRIVPGTSSPLDAFTAPSGAYSFRRLRSAYGGPAIRLRRASDNAELDIGFLGCTGFTGCPIDTAAASAHCAATSCFVRTWYDQSGNVRDLGQATPASQFPFIFNCNGTLPCVRGDGTALQSVFGGTSVVPTAPISISAVGNNRVLGAGSPQCFWMMQNGAGNRLYTFAAGWYLVGTTSLAAVPTPTANAWHAQQGVINGAASVIDVDGVETTGTVAAITTSGAPVIQYAGTLGSVCDFAEGIYWNAYGVTAPERAFLRNNQKSFWGTP